MKNTVYCPLCAREIYNVREGQTMFVTVRCDCGVYYKINPYNRKAIKIDKPPKQTSSGATFY